MTGVSNSKLPRAIAILAVVLAMLCTVTIGKTIYVDDATGINDGSNWADTYNCPQDTLSEANVAEKPVEIWGAQGIYMPDQGKSQIPGDREATFQLVRGITLLGGFIGVGEVNPDDRDVELGTLTTGKRGKGTLHARVKGDCCGWFVVVGV